MHAADTLSQIAACAAAEARTLLHTQRVSHPQTSPADANNTKQTTTTTPLQQTTTTTNSTPEEFAAGHVPGAINVPVAVVGPSGGAREPIV